MLYSEHGSYNEMHDRPCRRKTPWTPHRQEQSFLKEADTSSSFKKRCSCRCGVNGVFLEFYYFYVSLGYNGYLTDMYNLRLLMYVVVFFEQFDFLTYIFLNIILFHASQGINESG